MNTNMPALADDVWLLKLPACPNPKLFIELFISELTKTQHRDHLLSIFIKTLSPNSGSISSRKENENKNEITPSALSLHSERNNDTLNQTFMKWRKKPLRSRSYADSIYIHENKRNANSDDYDVGRATDSVGV